MKPLASQRSVSQQYVDSNNLRKNNGIYCPVLDRWVLIDRFDHRVTLDTAFILSSKIATIVYILPHDLKTLTNKNCLNFALLDKTTVKKHGGSALITGQLPVLRHIYDTGGELTEYGMPEDFKNNIEILRTLKEYVDYVHRYMYAISITEQMVTNDFKIFPNNILPSEWIDQITLWSDKNLKNGILGEIRKILYHSITIDEANKQIEILWNSPHENTKQMKKFFYDIIQDQLNTRYDKIN